MTIERIEELLGLLPADAPYLVRIPRSLSVQGFPPDIANNAYAFNDPSFGWGFVKSFLDLGRPLPALVYESQLLRPYCCLMYAASDKDARAALELEHPANRQRRILLRCMLLRTEYTYAAIAKKLNLSEEAIRIYEMLFWNVRDRDRAYICSLIYPDTRQVEFVPGYFLHEDPEMVALRAAYHHGIDVVEALLGMKDPLEDSNGVEHGRALAARFLSAANFVAKIGGIHQDLPALANARQLLSSVGRGQWKHSNQPGMDDDDRRGLGGMSLGRSLSETFMEIVIKPNTLSVNLHNHLLSVTLNPIIRLNLLAR
jgi:hypothetical protein